MSTISPTDIFDYHPGIDTADADKENQPPLSNSVSIPEIDISNPERLQVSLSLRSPLGEIPLENKNIGAIFFLYLLTFFNIPTFSNIIIKMFFKMMKLI